MSKVIVYKNLDGTCGVVIPSLKCGLTIKQIAQKDVPSGLKWRITDVSNLPEDKDFRDAWTDDNDTETVDVDMSKARDLHMDYIRVLRDKKLQELDIETMKGIDVQNQKQNLRDVPSTLDLSVAKTPEELKSILPDVLV